MDPTDSKARRVIDLLAEQNGKESVDIVHVILAAYERGESDQRERDAALVERHDETTPPPVVYWGAKFASVIRAQSGNVHEAE